MSTKNMIRIITLSMGLLSAVPVMSYAQTSAAPQLDRRWTPYVGCWRLFQENATLGLVMSDVMIVCAAPAPGTSGLVMTTYGRGQKILTQTIVADGQPHQVSDGDCQGTQTSEWSHDGERLFTRAEISCTNQPNQVVSGVTLFTNGPRWVDVQATEVDGNTWAALGRCAGH